jgi:hypothetical protein
MKNLIFLSRALSAAVQAAHSARPCRRLIERGRRRIERRIICDFAAAETGSV